MGLNLSNSNKFIKSKTDDVKMKILILKLKRAFRRYNTIYL